MTESHYVPPSPDDIPNTDASPAAGAVPGGSAGQPSTYEQDLPAVPSYLRSERPSQAKNYGQNKPRGNNGGAIGCLVVFLVFSMVTVGLLGSWIAYIWPIYAIPALIIALMFVYSATKSK
jgi:hypothetical protein